MSVPVKISPWKAAPFDLEGETVFAIGDVHGCADELASLLDTVRALARQSDRPRRLVYLGDVVDRGPDSLGVLRLWAEDAKARGVDRVDRIIGNHEILMLLAMSDGRRAREGRRHVAGRAHRRQQGAGGDASRRARSHGAAQL